MKIPHNSIQMWNMALTVILPPPLGAAYTENVPITFVCHDTSKQGESTPQ